ncbi:MerR family transcriptional regulator [Stackebrandtia soli]|uniref:MerR family transcriptional regulator n=1 Tax=Stackebrandtia soli TaxID=1892856 RepID=UPI0039EC3D34
MDRDERWPIAELARRVGLALADGYEGQASGRVRDVPDVRAIRWYTTIGLLDKPVAFRGRTALYERRHLWQVVAVKRRQAAGAPLAEIQAELAGASDARLAEIAQVPSVAMVDTSPPAVVEDAGDAVPRTSFWRSRPLAAASPHVETRNEPASATEPTIEPGVDGVSEATASSGVDLRFMLDLGFGVAITFPTDHRPTHADVAALRRAAQPLLRAAEARGLTDEGARS